MFTNSATSNTSIKARLGLLFTTAIPMEKLNVFAKSMRLGFATTRPENLLGEQAYGMEFTSQYNLAKWWKLDFNFNLVDLDGKPIDSANAGKLVANALVQQSKGDALKFWEWALSLNKGEALDLDSSDQETLKNFIKDNENFAIIAKAQLLQVFKKD